MLAVHEAPWFVIDDLGASVVAVQVTGNDPACETHLLSLPSVTLMKSLSVLNHLAPVLCSGLLLAFSSACDSPPEQEGTGTPNNANSGNTVASNNTTSTTGGTSSSEGLVYPTGRGCTPGVLDLTQTLQGRWDKLKVAVDGHQYFLQVNQWNQAAEGTQTMQVGGGFFFKMTAQTATAATNMGPTGYPSIFIGGNSNNVTDNSNLPKQVSTLAAVPTSWSWKDAGTLANRTANSYNASYDVWFSVGADGEPSASHPSGAFLMVWYHKPSDAQPVGSVKDNAITVPNVPGTWNVWTGINNNTPIISYTALQTISSMDFDLMDFIRHAMDRGDTVQGSHYLTNIFAGFEIWRGGVGLETTSFCAEVL